MHKLYVGGGPKTWRSAKQSENSLGMITPLTHRLYLYSTLHFVLSLAALSSAMLVTVK